VTQKAWRVLQVLGALFGQRQESEADTKATLDRISQITQVGSTRKITVVTATLDRISQITQVLDVERGVVVMVMMM